MATYNLINNSIFRSTTSSGTGNKDLSQLELSYLIDGVTTSSGVLLGSTDVLYLDVDFHQRINVNGIFLYADDLTKLSNINFYYKNHAEDDFYGCTKDVSTTYTAIIPSPSSPRYVRCTVSGVDINLFEFTIFNDDTKVKFGDDGTADTTWLTDTPIGEYGTPQAVEIYNTSITTVTAYACIDYLGDKDSYVKIASSEDGEYSGFADNVVAGYDYGSWDAGEFDNVEVNALGKLVLSDPGSSDVLVSDWINMLPLDICYYRGRPFGWHAGWVYDSVNELVWAAFYTGTNDTNGVLKLYKYTVATNTWAFSSEIYRSDINAYRMAFTCDDTYLYFLLSASDNFYVYRHDPAGAAGNLTSLGTTSRSGYGILRKYMTTDGNGNIYLLIPHNASSGDTYLYEFYSDASTPITLVSDTERIDGDYTVSWVYSSYTGDFYMLPSANDVKWVRRYRRSTNDWTNRFFNYGDRIAPGNSTIVMYAHDKYLYFHDASYGNTLYRYDLSTDLVEQKPINFTLTTAGYPYMIIRDAMESGDDFTAFMAGVSGSDWYYMYGYNTGYEQQSNLQNVIPGEGTYTTPMIYLDDPYKSSYLKVLNTSEPGVTSVSLDPTVHDGTIEIRTSREPLVPVDEIYWSMPVAASNLDLFRYTVGTNVWEHFLDIATSRYYYTYDTAVCRRSGKIGLTYYYAYYSASYYLAIYDRDKNTVKGQQAHYRSYRGMYFDGTTALWFYDEQIDALTRVPVDDITVQYETGYDPYAIAADLNGGDCWYTERTTYTLNRVSSSGNLELTLNLHSPYGLCSTEDNCVWVAQSNEPVYGNCVQKYDRWGNLLQTIITKEALFRLAYDHQGGFYARGESDLGNFYYYDSQGNLILTITGHYGYDYIKGGKRGFVTYNSSDRRATYISNESGEVLWTLSQQELGHDMTYSQRCPDIFCWDETSEQHYVSFYKSLLPVSYDPIWYGQDLLPWVEVPKDGYFLPNNIRHQARITLRNFDGTSTPEIESVVMAPAVKITDIPPKESKPMYVKSDIPGDADFTQFGLKIKVWWNEG